VASRHVVLVSIDAKAILTASTGQMTSILLLPVQTQRRLFAEWLARRARVPRPLGRLAARWTLLLRQWRDAPATEAAFQVPAEFAGWRHWCDHDLQRTSMVRRRAHWPAYIISTPSESLSTLAGSGVAVLAAQT
jgi:hypothetical protein